MKRMLSKIRDSERWMNERNMKMVILCHPLHWIRLLLFVNEEAEKNVARGWRRRKPSRFCFRFVRNRQYELIMSRIVMLVNLFFSRSIQWAEEHPSREILFIYQLFGERMSSSFEDSFSDVIETTLKTYRHTHTPWEMSLDRINATKTFALWQKSLFDSTRMIDLVTIGMLAWINEYK